MINEEVGRQQFAAWLTQQLRQRGWTQGQLILQSGTTDEDRLSSATVSRYSTGKMLPDAASCQKIARAFNLPVELVLRKAGLIDPLPDEDWLQRAIDNLAYAVDVGQLSEDGRSAIVAQLERERRLQKLKLEEDIAKHLANNSDLIAKGISLVREGSYFPNAIGAEGRFDFIIKDNDGNYYAIEIKSVSKAQREAITEASSQERER